MMVGLPEYIFVEIALSHARADRRCRRLAALQYGDGFSLVEWRLGEYWNV
jgi:hypothetical protein